MPRLIPHTPSPKSERRRAQPRETDIQLDQIRFVLDEKRHAAFLNLLDEPPKPAKALKTLLATKPPWEA